MSVKTITSEILREATSTAKSIVNEARKEAETIIASRQKECDLILADSKKKAAAEAKTIKQTEMARAHFELKNENLLKMRGLIDESFEDALKKLVNSTRSQKQDVAKKLLALAKKQIKVERVFADDDVASVLTGVTVVPKKIDGIIAETGDSSISIDLTYQQILDSIKQESVEAISELFQET